MAKEYRAITYFTDLQDHNHPYNVGDKFPREGLEVDEMRIKELSTPFNIRNEVMIEEVTTKRKKEGNDDD
jgi:hypothetical protein